MTEARHSAGGQTKIPRVEVYWHAVTYRTVVLWAAILLAVVLLGLYLMRPGAFATAFDRIADSL